jgi:hypothetical protein
VSIVGADIEQKQARNINRANEKLADSARQAFQMLADRTVSLQESNLRLTQDFFQNWIEQLQSQSQAVQEQSQRQREAFETLNQEATNAYSEFLNSALSFYQEAMSTASQAAQDNLQGASQPTQQGVQAIQQAAEVTEVANQTVQRVALAGGSLVVSSRLATRPPRRDANPRFSSTQVRTARLRYS